MRDQSKAFEQHCTTVIGVTCADPDCPIHGEAIRLRRK